MSNNLITAEQWLQSEIFLNNTLPLLFCAIGLLLFVTVFVLIYVTASKRKKVIIGSLMLSMCLLSFYSYRRVEGLTAFNQLARNQSVAIRDRKKKVFTYDYYRQQQGKESDVAKLENLPFYQKSQAVDRESITYYGKTDYVYYFKIKKSLYMLNINSKNIDFQEDLEEPIRTGYKFTLNDQRFVELGFYPEIGPIYTQLVIPLSMVDLEYEDLDERPKQFEF